MKYNGNLSFKKYSELFLILFSVIDCVMGEWGSWSSCDSDCGRGVARRSRHVIHPAANGGAECDGLEQTRSCTGEGDCTRRNREIVSAFTGKCIYNC